MCDSGREWVIGRNGICIEPDVEFIETYKSKGEIANCAGNGKCGYTTRSELAYAYARMLTEPKRDMPAAAGLLAFAVLSVASVVGFRGYLRRRPPVAEVQDHVPQVEVDEAGHGEELVVASTLVASCR